MLYVFEDSEAVIKMIARRQDSNNETRVKNPQSCSGLFVWKNQFVSLNSNPVYDTTHQQADMLNKGNFHT